MAHWKVALVLVLAVPLGAKSQESETCQQNPRDVTAMLQGSVGVQRVAEVLSSVMPPIAGSGNTPPTHQHVMPPTGNSPPSVVPPTGNTAPVPQKPGGAAGDSNDVGIHFGGAKRSDSQSGTLVYRPEAVHSEVCDGPDACAPCDSMSNCWHGAEPNALAIIVPLGDTKTYSATMFASCTSKKGYWQVYVNDLTNANLNVYLNDDDVAYTLTDANVDPNGKQEREYRITGDKIGKEAQIKISLSHSQQGNGPASAKLAIFAMANKYVDTCMDRTFCLKKLGEGSQAAFELRNSNAKQYACLTGNPAKNLAKVCTEWRVCFASQKDGSHEKELLKLLSAVFSKKSALLDVSSPLLAEDTKGCVDPAASDAEAVECECLDSMVKSCEAAGISDHEKCFKIELCKSDNICDSWKKENCPGSLLMLRSSMNQKTSDTLNGALAGKCTSETRL